MTITYFSKEFGIKSSIPTYAGGLGVLAGDIAKSAADLEMDFVGITLLNTSFNQRLDCNGWQTELPNKWNPSFDMRKLLETVDIGIEERKIKVGAWEYDIVGHSRKRHIVPVYFLDTDVEGNDSKDRKITSDLYPDDPYQKLVQNMVLSIGGLHLLKKLGYDMDNAIVHMNESPPTIVAVKRYEEYVKEHGEKYGKEKIKEKCVFTSHTGLPHGNECFEYPLVRKVMNHQFSCDIENLAEYYGKFSQMILGMNLSRSYTVSRKAAEVFKEKFGYAIGYINNGVHPHTWTAPRFQELYDETIPEWRNDTGELRKANLLDKVRVWNAHQSEKKRMIDYLETRRGIKLDPKILTIGFARRATPYKRANLILSDPERLLKIGKGIVQLVFAGKAHQGEWNGKKLIYDTVQAGNYLTNKGIPTVYDDDYNMYTGALFTAGVDVWLNTPRKPLESSGSSGMKAAFNGVPSLSVLDGWWIDGCIEGVTGWSIGDLTATGDLTADDKNDADSLYRKLEETIIPMYYHRPADWLDVMIGTIAHNASYFNTQRLLKECDENFYRSRVSELVKI